jgi:general stress protein 26
MAKHVRESHMPTSKQIDELYELIADIETAMFTTRRTDGQLVSRPMSTQKRAPIADLWFVTDIESHKVDELEQEPQVNLGYFNGKSYEWVSVSGIARVSTDRALIRSLYQSDWKAWFGELDDVRNGGPDDPRLGLILVDASTVVYLKQDKPRPVVLFEVLKGMVTGDRVEAGEVRQVNL